ncbi:MAG: hypothetical protein J5I92_04515 [Thiogranum sp.]|nr:hypothetical protein [Thiogranum sp.]
MLAAGFAAALGAVDFALVALALARALGVAAFFGAAAFFAVVFFFAAAFAATVFFFTAGLLAAVFFCALVFVFAAFFLAAIQLLPTWIKQAVLYSKKFDIRQALSGPAAIKCGSFRLCICGVKSETAKRPGPGIRLLRLSSMR